ncbi:MAG TPA: hypothetical protein VM260_18200 [Pirellula sp.]|nr:hypothetical protein [Pirellula sp.]
MKVDFDKILVSLDGEQLSDGKNPLTLGRACAAALVAQQTADVSLADHVIRFKLGQKVISGKHDLAIEEVALLKERVSKQFTASIVVGQIAVILEGEKE